jgi:hypothetical protein
MGSGEDKMIEEVRLALEQSKAYLEEIQKVRDRLGITPLAFNLAICTLGHTCREVDKHMWDIASMLVGIVDAENAKEK